METGIHNTSEIGRLRKVLLHRPGQELENLMPEYLERLLFDDIPYLKEAQAEHDAFAQCLRDAGVEVVYLIDLVVNSLTSPEVRQELITQFLKEADLPDEAAGKAVAEYLSELDDRAMVSAMMAGIRRSDLRKQGGRLSDHLSGLEEGYPFAVDPMPNLYFTRDPFATIGTGVSIHKMHTVTRNRETLFGRFIFEHNPWYQNAPRWYDRSASSSLEGGDILVLSPQVLAVGISQRTEGDSIDQLAQTVLSQSKTFQKVLAFNIPKSRSFMHLDTVFTMVDRDKFTVHPNILSAITVYVMELDERGQVKIRQEDGKEVPFTLTKGLMVYAERTNISPNGKWLCAAYAVDTATEGMHDVITSKCPAFFNTETGKTYIFDEYSGSARSATDDGIGFIVNSGGASGYVVDIESGTQLGTTEQWIYDNYGITVPAGYIQRLCPNGMVLGYSVMNVGPGLLSVAWYVRPAEM